MADIKLDVKYRLDLNRDEWLVVSKALRAYGPADGVIPDPQASGLGERARRQAEEWLIARDLQEQMLQQKAATLTQMAQEAERHVDNISSPRRKP